MIPSPYDLSAYVYSYLGFFRNSNSEPLQIIFFAQSQHSRASYSSAERSMAGEIQLLAGKRRAFRCFHTNLTQLSSANFLKQTNVVLAGAMFSCEALPHVQTHVFIFHTYVAGLLISHHLKVSYSQLIMRGGPYIIHAKVGQGAGTFKDPRRTLQLFFVTSIFFSFNLLS